MSAASAIDGLNRHNEGRSITAWGRAVRVDTVNELARLVGVEPRSTKDATLAAIARAPRPAAVEEGLSALTSGRSLRAWGRRVRAAEVSALAQRVGVTPQSSKASTIDAIMEISKQAKTIAGQAKAFSGSIDPLELQASKVFDAARLRLFQDLAMVRASTDTARMAAYHQAIQTWGKQLKLELNRQLATAERAMQKLALEHLRELFGTTTSAVSRLAALRGLQMHRSVVDKFVAEMAMRLMRQLATYLSSTPLRTAQNLAGPSKKSVVGGYDVRAALIARMEALRAYNEAQIAIAHDIQVPKGRVLRKRIVEIIDQRNHPFSRAADGTIAAINDPFEVSVAAVNAAAAAMKKSSSGVFWGVRGGSYVGMSLPAHYNDRARIVVELVT